MAQFHQKALYNLNDGAVTGKASINRIVGAIPGKCSQPGKKRLIAELGDSNELWLDENKVIGASNMPVFQVKCIHSAATRAMKVYKRNKTTGFEPKKAEIKKRWKSL